MVSEHLVFIGDEAIMCYLVAIHFGWCAAAHDGFIIFN